MEKVNNINGIDFYYEIDKKNNCCIIRDSSMNYFNDITLEQEDYDTDFEFIRETLKQTNLKEMCDYFGCDLYDDYKKLIKENDLNNYKEDNILENDFVNRFVVNDKVYYTYQ